MHGEATILHADLDAFFASVEQRDDPSLRGRPLAVGGGVVLAASYEAKAFGVTSAMGGATARRLCPGLVFVEPHFDAYVAASKAVFEVFERTTPIVEALSIDEAFLEVGGLRRIAGAPVDIAQRLRADVRDAVGLPITVGVATTKFLAKVASAVAKPDGLLVVTAGGELAFLHPLPVERLWGVGAVTAEKLHGRGIRTVAEMAALPEASLVSLLGAAAGHHLHALAHNRDPRVVQTGRGRRSIGSQSALGRGPHRASELDATLVGIVDRVSRRMRGGHRVGRTVILRLRFDDFARATRSHTVDQATAHTETILSVARGLLADAMTLIRERGVTLVGLAVTNLSRDDAVQLALPFSHRRPSATAPARPDRDPGLDGVLDQVRERFGSDSLTRAVLLGRRSLSMPTLPIEPVTPADVPVVTRSRPGTQVGKKVAAHGVRGGSAPDPVPVQGWDHGSTDRHRPTSCL